MNFAAVKENSGFYFYNDVHNFVGDPTILRVAYEDDLTVTDEIYSRVTFNNPVVR